jgi:hypothetical protein
MPLGSPSIPTLRADAKTGAIDVRSLQGVINAIAERLRQIEATLGGAVTVNNAGLFSALSSQDDGLVVKSQGILVTRKLTVSAGLAVDNATGALDPKISAPMLDDLQTQPDGLVVKTGSDALTRTLIGGSGSGITIHHPDGVTGDPDFTVP